MLDAAELALALTSGSDFSTAIATYEMAMFQRASVAAEESAQNLDESIADDAPRGMVTQMARHAEIALSQDQKEPRP